FSPHLVLRPVGECAHRSATFVRCADRVLRDLYGLALGGRNGGCAAHLGRKGCELACALGTGLARTRSARVALYFLRSLAAAAYADCPEITVVALAGVGGSPWAVRARVPAPVSAQTRSGQTGV